MLMEMGQSTILNSFQLQCIGTDLNAMSIFTKHSSILIRITVGEFYKTGILGVFHIAISF